jgi:hypothetical protein
MCLKNNVMKRLYVVLNVAAKQPQALCVLPNRPLYHQLYEDTKNNDHLTQHQLEILRIAVESTNKVKLVPIDVPPSFVLQ